MYGASLAATVCLLFVYVFLNHHYHGDCWQSMQPSKSALTGEYCEQDVVSHFFRQRMNTYSNLLYFFLGMLVVLIAYHDKKERTGNPLQQFPLLSFFFGTCLIYLCLGSSFFHASLTWVGQRVDMNGTYSVCISLVAITYYRLFASEKSSLSFQWTMVSFLFLLVLFFCRITPVDQQPVLIAGADYFDHYRYCHQLYKTERGLSLTICVVESGANDCRRRIAFGGCTKNRLRSNFLVSGTCIVAFLYGNERLSAVLVLPK